MDGCGQLIIDAIREDCVVDQLSFTKTRTQQRLTKENESQSCCTDLKFYMNIKPSI